MTEYMRRSGVKGEVRPVL